MSLIENTLNRNALGQITLKDFPRVMGMATRKLTSDLDSFLIVFPYLSLSILKKQSEK